MLMILNANDLGAKHFGPQILGPLFLAKGASLGDLRFASRMFDTRWWILAI